MDYFSRSMKFLVILLIALILIATVIFLISNQQVRARDKQRIVDLKSYAQALELYYLDNGHYPIWCDRINIKPYGRALHFYYLTDDYYSEWEEKTRNKCLGGIINGQGSPLIAEQDFEKYLDRIINDPLSPEQNYYYQTDKQGKNYLLVARLENIKNMPSEERLKSDLQIYSNYYQIYTHQFLPDGLFIEGILRLVNGGLAIEAPKLSVDFEAEPLVIIKGESLVLSWSAINADSCLATDGWSGEQLLVGEKIVSPKQTTTYTLTCVNQDDESQKSVKIEVFKGLFVLSETTCNALKGWHWYNKACWSQTLADEIPWSRGTGDDTSQTGSYTCNSKSSLLDRMRAAVQNQWSKIVIQVDGNSLKGYDDLPGRSRISALAIADCLDGQRDLSEEISGLTQQARSDILYQWATQSGRSALPAVRADGTANEYEMVCLLAGAGWYKNSSELALENNFVWASALGSETGKNWQTNARAVGFYSCSDQSNYKVSDDNYYLGLRIVIRP